MTDGYRERPFKVAFAVSVVIHAALIAFIPGLRSVPVETPRVLDVEIVPMHAPLVPSVQEKPVVPPKMVEPKIEPVPEPKPEFVLPRPELRPAPKAESRLESMPEPKIEPRPEPAPIARVEPRPEPQPTPTVEPQPEPRPEPRTESRPEPQPLPQEAPPPVVAPQPQPSAPRIDEAHENRLLVTYGQSISKEIKRYQKYPLPAQRRGWEGTAEVLLKIAADGKVTGITLGRSSGHTILDDEALDMVRRASPLPQAPPDLRGRALVVSVPIVFRLQNS